MRPTEALRPLEHRLTHLLEPRIREATLSEWAVAQPPELLYACVRTILARPAPDDSSFDPLLETLYCVVATPSSDGGLPEHVRDALADRASAGADARILRLLCPPPPARRPDEPLSIPKALEDIPLGRRRSLAKGFERRLLEQLAQDPDPGVIRNLLQNARIRESDVERLAAARPVATSTLEAIGREPRWSQRIPIRVALARNPYSPGALAMRMQNGLPLSELREISEDRTLHPEVCRHAREALETRQQAALGGGAESDGSSQRP